MENHEGEELRKYLKKNDLGITEAAEKLGMTRQNLNYHLRKEALEDDFMRLVQEKLKIFFPLSKMNFPHGKMIDQTMTLTDLAAYVMKNQAILEVLIGCVAELLAEKRKGSATTIVKDLERAINQRLQHEDAGK